jgi:hypothetical protein
MSEQKPLTHSAFAMKREGRAGYRWLEVGMARIESDGATGHHVYLDRMPIGGFTGHIYLSPAGVAPPVPEPLPQRPEEAGGEDGEGEEF